jgi:hypothetical protein
MFTEFHAFAALLTGRCNYVFYRRTFACFAPLSGLPKYGYCTHVWCILQRLQKVSKREKGPNVISETLENETFWMHLRRNNVMPWQLCLGA